MYLDKISLADLAFASFVYSGTTDYDAAYRSLADGGFSELAIEQHCLSLLVWLNAWGCRQFSKVQHTLVVNSLLSWFRKHSRQLPNPNMPLKSLGESDLNELADAYEALRGLTASVRSDGVRMSVGPTGAAKILFALRPKQLPPWDDPIRKKFELDGNKKSYVTYLQMVQTTVGHLHQQLRRIGMNEEDFAVTIRRPGITLPKLLDEYFWMTITRRFCPPSKDALERWLRWKSS